MLEHGITLQNLIDTCLNALRAGGSARSSSVLLSRMFGISGTGVRIEQLSGIVQSRASIAWLGGGPLALGGGGIFLGGLLLYGITISAACISFGTQSECHGQRTHTQALVYAAEIDNEIARIDSVIATLDAAKLRIEELKKIKDRLRYDLTKNLNQLNASVFDPESEIQLKTLFRCQLLANALREVIEAPILNENGELTNESFIMRERYHRYSK